jgi:hypothetical protein
MSNACSWYMSIPLMECCKCPSASCRRTAPCFLFLRCSDLAGTVQLVRPCLSPPTRTTTTDPADAAPHWCHCLGGNVTVMLCLLSDAPAGTTRLMQPHSSSPTQSTVTRPSAAPHWPGRPNSYCWQTMSLKTWHMRRTSASLSRQKGTQQQHLGVLRVLRTAGSLIHTSRAAILLNGRTQCCIGGGGAYALC